MTSIKDFNFKAVAKEINDIVPLDHPIKIKGVDEDELKEQITLVAEQVIDPEEDKLSKSTIFVLEYLQCSPYKALADKEEKFDLDEVDSVSDSELDKALGVFKESENTPKKRGRPGTKTLQIRKKIVEIVARGGVTRAECVNEIADLGFNKHTVNSQLYMCTDSKYNKLDRLVVAKDDGTLGFDV